MDSLAGFQFSVQDINRAIIAYLFASLLQR